MNKNISSIDEVKNNDNKVILSFLTGLGMFSIFIVVVICIIQFTNLWSFIYNK